jgi:hypothetical protein
MALDAYRLCRCRPAVHVYPAAPCDPGTWLQTPSQIAGWARLGQCFSSMRRTWLGLDRRGGGAIDLEQPERSWNEFVLHRKRVGSANPLSWSSKVLHAAASRRASLTASEFSMQRAVVTTCS